MSVKPFVLFLSACAVALTALMPVQAHADNDRHDRGRGQGNSKNDHRGHDRGRDWGRPSHHGYYGQPRVVTRYVPARPVYQTHYYQPQRVFVGQRLVRYEPVPVYVHQQLSPPPYGYYYAASGPDVVLVSQQDNTIVQILDLLLHHR